MTAWIDLNETLSQNMLSYLHRNGQGFRQEFSSLFVISYMVNFPS